MSAVPSAAACTWSVVPSPNVGSDSNRLWDVSASSGRNVWAVGHTSGFDNKPVVIRWTQGAWQKVKIPASKGGDTYLSGVVAVSKKDVWVVGASLDAGISPFIRHWDGSGWEIVKPPAGTAGGQLEGVAEGARGDIWAVGQRANNGLILRWDGTRWQKIKHPDPGSQANALWDVTRVPGTRKLWAVGGAAGPTNTDPLMLLWNGRKWLHIPGPFANDGNLRAVSAAGPDDVWAVGEEQQFNFAIYLAEHWDGSSWSKISPLSPSSQFPGNLLGGVVARPGSATVAGFYTASSSGVPSAIDWNGTSWSPATTPALTGAAFRAVAPVPNSQRLWAVGEVWDGLRFVTLTERCA